MDGARIPLKLSEDPVVGSGNIHGFLSNPNTIVSGGIGSISEYSAAEIADRNSGAIAFSWEEGHKLVNASFFTIVCVGKRCLARFMAN